MADMSLADRVNQKGAHLKDDLTRAARKDFETLQATGIVSLTDLIGTVVDPRREPSIRLIACSLLAWLDERSAAPVIAKALVNTDDDALIWESAKALIELRAENSTEILINALKRGSIAQKSAAAYVLGATEALASIPDLLATAGDPTLDDSVRGHAIEALGAMRADEAVEKLLELLSSKSPEIRYWAAYSLGQIGDEVSIPLLEDMAAHDSERLGPPHNRSLREEALEALENIREQSRNRR